MRESPLETVFRVRTLPGGRRGTFVLILWLAGMGGMLLGLLLTFGNMFGGMAGLLLPMIWIGLKMTRRAEYGVGADGVRETLLDSQGKPESSREKRYRWDQVESWLVDSDLVRGIGSRRFVELRLRDGYRMRFREANDRPDDPEFSAFAQVLEQQAGASTQQQLPQLPQLPQPGQRLHPSRRLPPPVPGRPPTSIPVRRRSFYERPIAKLITLAFIAMTIGLLIVAITAPQYFGGGAWFRLLVIIVPGTLYMVARTFGKR